MEDEIHNVSYIGFFSSNIGFEIMGYLLQRKTLFASLPYFSVAKQRNAKLH